MAEEKNSTDSRTGSITQQKRTRVIKQVSWVSIIGNALLAVLKMGFGFIAGSFALISDGIDSLLDVLTSGITYVTASISSQPPDMKHPYGHGRAETIATKILSFVIFFAGSQLVVASVQRLVNGEFSDVPAPAPLYVALISIIGKILLSVYKKRMGVKYRSPMLMANAKNMKNDVLISGGVFVGILCTRVFNVPVLDPLIAAGIGVYILISALGIFSETSLELMDGISDKDLYREVFEAVNSVKAANNPHKTRIRKLNNMYIIDMDIEVDGSLTVKQGHAVAMTVEKKIQDTVPNVYDVQVHVEPEGNVEDHESFGVTEDLLK